MIHASNNSSQRRIKFFIKTSCVIKGLTQHCVCVQNQTRKQRQMPAGWNTVPSNWKGYVVCTLYILQCMNQCYEFQPETKEGQCKCISVLCDFSKIHNNISFPKLHAWRSNSLFRFQFWERQGEGFNIFKGRQCNRITLAWINFSCKTNALNPAMKPITKVMCTRYVAKYIILQWWIVNPGSDCPEISLVQTKVQGPISTSELIGDSVIRKTC